MQNEMQNEKQVITNGKDSQNKGLDLSFCTIEDVAKRNEQMQNEHSESCDCDLCVVEIEDLEDIPEVIRD